MKIRLLAGVAALVGLGAVAAPQAEAALELTVIFGGQTIEITDNLGGDLNGTEGVILASVGTGTFITLDGTSSLGGTPALPSLSISSTGTPSSGTNLNTQTLTVVASQDGYTSTATNYDIGVSGTFTIPPRTTDVPPVPSATFSYEIDGTPIGSNFVLTYPPASGAANTTISLGFVPTGPFTLTQRVVITGVDARSTFSVGGTISAVPEPMTLALFGSGLVALGLVRRRKPA